MDSVSTKFAPWIDYWGNEYRRFGDAGFVGFFARSFFGFFGGTVDWEWVEMGPYQCLTSVADARRGNVASSLYVA